jgi:hypothetical protein
MPQNYLFGVRPVLKNPSRSSQSIKSYSTFSSGQTDAQTQALPSIFGQVKFLMPLFETSHFTTFIPVHIYYVDWGMNF